MFKVPLSADQETLEPCETISFWRWLTSSKAQRADWAHRKSTVFGRRGQAAIDGWAERHKRPGN